MHILLANTHHSYGGGDSTYTLNLANLLRSNGHEVSFFAMQDERNLHDPNEDLFVSPIDFRQLNQHKNLSNGLRVVARAIYSEEARRKFSVLLDRVKPDIVHLQNIHAHITPSIIFEARKHGLPVVWTLHDFKLICPNSHFLIDQTGQICEACHGGRFWEAAAKHCKKGSTLASGMASLEAYAHLLMNIRGMVDAFLCSSVFQFSKFQGDGYDPHKLHHLPLFLPLESFSEATHDDGYLLFLGKLDPIKGIYQLLEACRRTPETRVRLAGHVNETERAKITSQICGNVDYVGLKTGEEVRDLVRRCRAVVVPSISYENQPFSILEAFASSKPVIASNIGGMRELVKDLETGISVEPGNIDQLGRALAWMSDHPAKTHEMGQKAFAYARVVHSPQKHYEKLVSIYQRFL